MIEFDYPILQYQNTNELYYYCVVTVQPSVVLYSTTKIILRSSHRKFY